MNKLIAIYSPAPQSGKSLVASTIASRIGGSSVSFAKPLKDMLVPLLKLVLPAFEQPEDYLYGSKKQTLIPSLGVDCRRLMQTLGTDWGRNLIHPEIWVNSWKEQVTQNLKYGHVITDDLRFLNELLAVKELGGTCWWVARPGAEDTRGHASEGALEHHRGHFGVTIYNDSTKEALEHSVDTALRVMGLIP